MDLHKPGPGPGPHLADVCPHGLAGLKPHLPSRNGSNDLKLVDFSEISNKNISATI